LTQGPIGSELLCDSFNSIADKNKCKEAQQQFLTSRCKKKKKKKEAVIEPAAPKVKTNDLPKPEGSAQIRPLPLLGSVKQLGKSFRKTFSTASFAVATGVTPENASHRSTRVAAKPNYKKTHSPKSPTRP
jgi:hypothetical protein